MNKLTRNRLMAAMFIATFVTLVGCEKNNDNSGDSQNNFSPAQSSGNPVYDAPQNAGTIDPAKIIPPAPIPEPGYQVAHVNCFFHQEDHQKKQSNKVTCFAAATLCEDHDLLGKDGHYQNDKEKDKDCCQDNLVVVCNGKTLFDDEPTRTTFNHYEILAGKLKHGSSLNLTFPQVMPGEDCEDQDAFLSIYDKKLEGKCRVEWSEERY